MCSHIEHAFLKVRDLYQFHGARERGGPRETHEISCVLISLLYAPGSAATGTAGNTAHAAHDSADDAATAAPLTRPASRAGSERHPRVPEAGLVGILAHVAEAGGAHADQRRAQPLPVRGFARDELCDHRRLAGAGPAAPGDGGAEEEARPQPPSHGASCGGLQRGEEGMKAPIERIREREAGDGWGGGEGRQQRACACASSAMRR